jgi:hypothetical protein
VLTRRYIENEFRDNTKETFTAPIRPIGERLLEFIAFLEFFWPNPTCAREEEGGGGGVVKEKNAQKKRSEKRKERTISVENASVTLDKN